MDTTSAAGPQPCAGLSPIWPDDPKPLVRQLIAERREKLVVLDDDPTGTQTVYDVPVLTTWDVSSLQAELSRDCPCFYLLTNSRGLVAEAARELNLEIAHNLQAAAREADCGFALVSRSDSTLRGHYPTETDALSEVAGPFQATIIAPYFEAGGRLTVGDVHYVVEGGRWTPAAETPFARDAVFGYRHSNLREWVEEKTGGRVKAAEVCSVGVEMLRSAAVGDMPAHAVAEHLRSLPLGSVCVVNACDPRDMEVFALATLLAERAGARFVYRTAAQFVAARLGLEPRPLWQPAKDHAAAGRGLVVVGSYVPKTTEQLQSLLRDSLLTPIELSVERLVTSSRDEEIARAVQGIQEAFRSGRDVVVYTSRQLVTAIGAQENLAIGQRVSAALVELVQRLESCPRYLVAKGGITSSDVATRGLGVRRAMVLGQILPGIPVWELGPESRFPGLPYVVFPGNVGGADALSQVVLKLR
ncbi:MAG: four-carbon acid sugar kinase family protein [Planctomycetota bacterium]